MNVKIHAPKDKMNFEDKLLKILSQKSVPPKADKDIKSI